MPLKKSSSKKAFKSNVKTLINEVGKSPHVQSRAQALAVAYSEQRQAKKKKRK
jgi:ABC-type hemin transport system substrate-binding protein